MAADYTYSLLMQTFHLQQPGGLLFHAFSKLVYWGDTLGRRSGAAHLETLSALTVHDKYVCRTLGSLWHRRGFLLPEEAQ